MPTPNYVLISRATVTVTTPSITFTNIPSSGYTDLKFVISARSTDGNTNYSPFGLQINGSAPGNAYRSLTGTGSATQSYGTTNDTFTASTAGGTWTRFQSSGIQAGGTTASVFANAELYIANYLSTANKTFEFDCCTEANGTTAFAEMTGGTFTSSSAISSIAFANRDGSFAAGSTISLYGIAQLGTSPTVLPKATGGDIIVNDGTYWYHAFLSTGTFTPASNLSCDYLVVAGGGAGGSSPNGQQGGGGGGAGGFRAFSAQSLTSATNYPVTIGAGGGTNASGSNSSFNSNTSAGGGYGGISGSGSGAAGGSGGGGSSSSSPGSGGAGNTPSTTPVQGYAGGNGQGTNNYACGGGGGATAAGNNGGLANDTLNSRGGAGSNAYSTWATATSTGVSGYYAGGGGGGFGQFGNFLSGSGGGTGGAGGGGNGATATTNSQATSGVANTGGGGGGSAESGRFTNSAVGGNGGSGIVIIRYAMA